MIAVAFVFVFFLALGVPICLVLAATGLVHIVQMNDWQLLTMVPNRMYAAASTSSLLAIPMFILAGELMGSGGITEKLADMMRSFIGHVKGGMAYVTMLVGCLLGALLGSANASAALQGRVLKPELDKDNYDDVFSACLIASSALMGPIIPPSMTLIVIGVTAYVSIGDLFIAGIVPGLMLTVAFMIMVAIIGMKNTTWKISKKATLRDRFNKTMTSLPTFIVPVIILGGIMSGITTPTESAVTASVAAFVLGKFYYQKLQWSHLPKVFIQTAVTTASIMIIVALANIMAWTLAMDQIPQAIAKAILSLSENKYVLLLLINFLLLFIGMIMETMAAIIIVVPVLMPVITSVGIDPLHFAMIVGLNLVIGMITPPVGITLFTTATATDVPTYKLMKPIWKWVGVAIIVLMLITYVPQLSTFLPALMNH